MNFGLSNSDIDKICDVFRKYKQIDKVVIYGSRAKGNYKKGSDIDLTLFGDELTFALQLDIFDDLDELLLPYTIDLSLYDGITSDKLKEHIGRVGLNFYERGIKPGWEIKKLGDVCEVITRGISPQYTESKGLIVLNQKCIRNHKINLELARLHDSAAKIVAANKIVKMGDVLVNSTGTGTLGRVAQVKDKLGNMVVDSHISIVRPIPNMFYDDFFGWAMIFIEDEIAKKGEGCGGQTELSRDVLKNGFSICYPTSLVEQQSIASMLDKTFSAIAKAKENAEQNLKNAKELFESYLRSIDANKVALTDLVNITTGKLNSNEAVEGGKYPFFTCSREIFSIDKFAFDLEAILLAGNNASGDFNVKHYKGKFNAYQRTYVITVNEKKQALYRYLYFQLLNSLKEFKNQSVGANTKFLKIGMIHNLQIPLPSIVEQERIIHTLDNLLFQTQQLETKYEQKLNNLEKLKKSILQNAFNGELNGNSIQS